MGAYSLGPLSSPPRTGHTYMLPPPKKRPLWTWRKDTPTSFPKTISSPKLPVVGWVCFPPFVLLVFLCLYVFGCCCRECLVLFSFFFLFFLWCMWFVRSPPSPLPLGHPPHFFFFFFWFKEEKIWIPWVWVVVVLSRRIYIYICNAVVGLVCASFICRRRLGRSPPKNTTTLTHK